MTTLLLAAVLGAGRKAGIAPVHDDHTIEKEKTIEEENVSGW